MIFDLEVTSMSTFNGIGLYWGNKKKTLTKYAKLWQTVEFRSLYMVESINRETSWTQNEEICSLHS